MGSSGGGVQILDEIMRRGRAALHQLTQADGYAAAAQCDPWQFAVEVGELRDAGLTHNDLRWLIRNGQLAHRIEVTKTSSRERCFRRGHKLAFNQRSCFLLTELGVQAFENVRHAELRRHVPRWDSERRELTIGDRIVKIFRQPAHAQETILAAFEEEGWPAVIDDPLPQSDGQDAKARLRVTIQNLNRNQRAPLIRFAGDGHGAGIRWEHSS